VNKQITEKQVLSASVVFVRVVLTQRLFGVLRSVGILNLAGSAVSPSGGLKHGYILRQEISFRRALHNEFYDFCNSPNSKSEVNGGL
jgi:hypothetical protein